MFSYVILSGYGISTTLITEIERYLAAHFAVLAYPSVQREQIDNEQFLLWKIGNRFGKYTLRSKRDSYGPTGILKEFSDGKRRIRMRMTSWVRHHCSRHIWLIVYLSSDCGCRRRRWTTKQTQMFPTEKQSFGNEAY
jgi:hypothetical protein